jgi:hypothetical protein
MHAHVEVLSQYSPILKFEPRLLFSFAVHLFLHFCSTRLDKPLHSDVFSSRSIAPSSVNFSFPRVLVPCRHYYHTPLRLRYLSPPVATPTVRMFAANS